MKKYLGLWIILILMFSLNLWAQTDTDSQTVIEDSVYTPPPQLDKPVIVFSSDVPDDGGQAVEIRWELQKSQVQPSHFFILRSDTPTGNFTIIDTVAFVVTDYKDTEVNDNTAYYYKISSFINDDFGPRTLISETSDPITSKANLFNKKRLNILVALIVFTAIMLWFIYSSTRKDLFIRKIAGLAAVGEAVGRSTEMGKPVLYVSGIGAVSEVQTLASLVILGEVAKVTAQYDTPLLVPVFDPILMTAAEEIVKESHMDVGRPDSYNPDNIRFITSEQFAYAAGVNGIMLRERPAAIIYMGVFYAESLMLAETGFSAGAIQVAGTAMVSQIPFFIAACDYCLMGEELYAASAYLSKEPKLLANLKSSDAGKLLFATLLLIGVIMATIGNQTFIHLFSTQ